MATRWTLRVRVQAGLLVGGQTSPVLADSATARLPSGLPLIPASALKGALRIEFERLARAAQRLGRIPEDPEVCEGGRGCQDRARLCIACRVFGSPGVEGNVRFSDAHLVGDARRLFVREGQGAGQPDTPVGTGYEVRMGVALDRFRRAAAEELLFSSEGLAPGPGGYLFEGVVEARSELAAEQEELLGIAASLLEGLGGDRTRGFGRVQVALEPAPATEPAAVARSRGWPASTPLTVELIPLEYVRVSGLKEAGNFMDSLGFIPGSTVRGAVARSFAESKACGAGWQDPLFRRSFLSQPAFFSEFYPTRHGAPPAPIPLSARTCKACPGFIARQDPTPGAGPSKDDLRRDWLRDSHGLRDVLIAATVAGRLRGMEVPAILEDRCARCGEPLKEFPGYYRPEITGRWVRAIGEVGFRTNTKVALSRRRGTSLEGALYSYELMDSKLEHRAGSRPRFDGVASNLTQELEDHLLGLEGQTLLIGGARLRGFGKVQLRVTASPPSDPGEENQELAGRLGRFTEAVRKPLLEVPGASGQLLEELRNRIFWSLTLRSDLALPPGDVGRRLREELVARLGLPARELYMERAIARTAFFRGGYNDAIGLPKPLASMVVRGGAFVFSCPASYQADVLAGLPALLREGLGLRREEGLGRVGFCDRFHLDRQQQS